MSELSQFVRKRAIDNTVTGIVIATHAGNPNLYEVRLPDGKQVTLATAGGLDLTPGDPVEVAIPSGDKKRAYLSDKAAIVLAGDPVNRVLGEGEG